MGTTASKTSDMKSKVSKTSDPTPSDATALEASDPTCYDDLAFSDDATISSVRD